MDQYDAIGQLYEGMKTLPVGLAEQGTLLAALPELTGKSVLDIGTGTGFYPRIYKALGATTVVGVDASTEMITYARRIEEQQPLGITYEIDTGGALPKLGDFDVVTAIWLLGYAEGLEALDGMLRNLLANLAPGGALVALTPNPEQDWEPLNNNNHYGLTCHTTEESHGRQGYAVHMLSDPPFDFVGFHWPPGVIEAALDRAGLKDIHRQPVTIPADALAERGDAYWAEFIANPTFAVYRGIRY
jgi:SAM-dependent methyltransferase